MAKEREAYMNLFPDDERDSPEEGTVAGHQGGGSSGWVPVEGGRVFHTGQLLWQASLQGILNLFEPNDYHLENIFKQCQCQNTLTYEKQ